MAEAIGKGAGTGITWPQADHDYYVLRFSGFSIRLFFAIDATLLSWESGAR